MIELIPLKNTYENMMWNIHRSIMDDYSGIIITDETMEEIYEVIKYKIDSYLFKNPFLSGYIIDYIGDTVTFIFNFERSKRLVKIVYNIKEEMKNDQNIQ